MLHYAKFYTNFYWNNTQYNTMVLFEVSTLKNETEAINYINIKRFEIFRLNKF